MASNVDYITLLKMKYAYLVNVWCPWRTCVSIQQTSASLSERHSMPRGPCRQELKVIGMSSASGRYAISRTKRPVLHDACTPPAQPHDQASRTLMSHLTGAQGNPSSTWILPHGAHHSCVLPPPFFRLPQSTSSRGKLRCTVCRLCPLCWRQDPGRSQVVLDNEASWMVPRACPRAARAWGSGRRAPCRRRAAPARPPAHTWRPARGRKMCTGASPRSGSPPLWTPVGQPMRLTTNLHNSSSPNTGP